MVETVAMHDSHVKNLKDERGRAVNTAGSI